MLLQGLHTMFLGFQILVAWEFLIKGIELRPEVAERFHLTDVNRHIYPYLTVWNLVVHITYLVACAVEDVLLSFTDESFRPIKRKLRKQLKFVFETVVFPGSLLVVSAYWVLTLMDPLYLFPGPIEDLIPSWINFLIHSGVGIFAIGEVILRRDAWSPYHAMKRLWIGCMIFVSYAIIICTHRYLTGAWIYPFIEYLSWLQRAGIYFILICFAGFCYYSGYSLSSFLHGNVPERSKQAHGVHSAD